MPGLVVGLVLLGGCAGDRPTGALDWPMQPRSIALPAQAQDRATQRQAARTGPAWYELRNEYQPTVEAGIAYPVLERSVTRTYDRQHIHGGRVNDHYHRNTYREQLRRIVR